MFFPVGSTTSHDLAQIEEAKAVCARCPVMDACRAWALETDQNDGVWGGLSEGERADLKRGEAQQQNAPAVALRPDGRHGKTDPVERPTCGTLAGYETHTRKRERQCGSCRTWKSQRRTKNPNAIENRIAELQHFADLGYDLPRAAEALDRHPRTIAEYLVRYRRHDLLERLNRRAA